MDTAANWSGDVVPTGATNDIAQWNGTAAGNLSLTYTAAGTGAGLAAGNGIFIDVTSGQTDSLTINEASGTVGLRLQNITIANGAGAFAIGGVAGTDAVTLGAGGVDIFTWTNNSTNTATIDTDVNLAFGGGDNDNTLTLTGSGNWLFNGHFGNLGTGSLISTTKSGSGTMTITGDTRGFNQGSVDQGAGQVFVKSGAIVIESGGVLRALSTGNAEFASIGQNGTDVGTLTVRGTGSFIDDGDFNVGDTGSSQGTLNIQDTATLTVAAAGGFFVGSANAAGSTASGIVNQSGGTVTVNRNVDGAFIIGGRLAGATGTGTYNLSGGTVANLGTAWIGGNGTGTVTHTAGDWNNTGAVFIGRLTGSTGTYHLNGGTLTTAGVNGGTGASTFNFNGGTLKAGANSATFMNGLTTANVRNAGAVIDTNNFNATMSQALVHSTIGGDNATDGGLTKNGNGILTLAGANTYNGPTTISGGTLAVTGSLNASSAVTVASGATLDGTGSVGAATVDIGGNVANGNGGTGTLTISLLTFNGTASVNARVGGGTPVVVSGLLDTTPGSGQVTINGTGTWASGFNPIIDYGTFTGGAITDFTEGSIAGFNARQISAGLADVGGVIGLNVTGDNPKWTGLDNGNWVVGPTGASSNWRLVTAGTATDYIENDAVLFDDSATGTAAVDITTASVSPHSTTFNNSTKNYTIAGSGGGIGGTGTLTKNGTGSATISANNSYSGVTTINAGTLTLSGSNSTIGGTALNGGTLNVDSASALGTGQLTIGSGGAKTLNNNSGSAITMSGDIAQQWDADFTFTGSSDLDMGIGAVTLGGSGTDRTVTVSNGTLTVGEVRSTSHGLVKQGTGTLILTSNGTSGNGAGTDGSALGTLNVAAGTLQFNRTEATTTGDFTATGITGSGRIVNGAASERWIHENNSGNFVFTGLLEPGGTGTLGFYKTGGGSQTLTGNNTINATLTANAGTLILSGNNTLGTVVVNAGTLRLEGANTYTAATALNTGGTIIVAHPGALGTTTRVNAVANNSSATLAFAIDTDTTNVTPIGLGTFSILNVISDRATPGAAVNRTMTVPTPAQGGGGIGGGTINFTAGANVTSGIGRITFNQFGLGAGAVTTTTLNPTGVNLTLGDVSKYNNDPNQTLDLGGTTAGNEITGVISNILPAGTNLAVVSLIKSNTSTWAISGANTYTGGTTVNGGTLLVNNTTGSGTGTGAITVNNGGTLGGTGTISTGGSNVLVNAGGSISPGASAGTLTFNLGAGGLNASAVTAGGFKFELNTPTTSDKVVVGSGTLTMGTVDFSDFTFTNLGGVAVGTYTLFDAPIGNLAASPGTLSGTFGGFAATLVIDNTNSDILLNVTGAAGTPGDFNNDSKVDAGDYVTWRKNNGTNNALANDGGLGTPIGQNHFNLWRANFGNPPGAGSGNALGSAGSAVPEPGTSFLMLLCSFAAVATRRFGAGAYRAQVLCKSC
jgi:autotransporter-associated beta strand protein